MRIFVTFFIVTALTIPNIAAEDKKDSFLKSAVKDPNADVKLKSNVGLKIPEDKKEKFLKWIEEKKEQFVKNLLVDEDEVYKKLKKDLRPDAVAQPGPSQQPVVEVITEPEKKLRKLKKKGVEKITLKLQNGSSITGRLLKETPAQYTVFWRGGEISFSKSEVVEAFYEDKSQKEGDIELNVEPEEPKWKYKNNFVLKLKNGSVIDAEILNTSSNQITMGHQLEQGGTVEQDILLETIEKFLTPEISNRESATLSSKLKANYPTMKSYKEGNTTIFTDSHSTWVARYKNLIAEAYKDIYLEFHPLFKDRAPTVQNFVVIFDNFQDYVNNAYEQGLPGERMLGYYIPQEKTAFFYNTIGDKVDELIQGYLGDYNQSVDQAVDQAASQVGDSNRVFIEGQAKEFRDKAESYYSLVREQLRKTFVETLRHEFAHELFHNYGIQSVKPSTTTEKVKGEVSASSEDFLKNILGVQESSHGDIQAANSWFVEGTATYLQTRPPGEVDKRWLFGYQEMKRQGKVLPLSQLSVYSLGSFVGLSHDMKLFAYSQSWAYVTFLMKNYKTEFLSYLNRLHTEKVTGDEDIIWLEEEIGKNSAILDLEFQAFMGGYDELPDPVVENFVKFREMFN